MIGFSIDNVRYNFPCAVQREADVRESENSGMLLDKTYFSDVLGTYMNYSISIAIPIGREADYAALYEVITSPVRDHVFELPYNQQSLTVVGRIGSIKDQQYRDGVWRKINFDIKSNNPTKEMSLGEVIERGVSELPLVTELDAGKIYYVNEYGEWGWTDKWVNGDVRKY